MTDKRTHDGPTKWKPLVYEPTAKNTVRLREVVPSTTVYRYMRLKQFEDLVNDRRLKLLPPQTWDDPHEQWWCESLFRKGSGLANTRAYALCWTTAYMDDAFWRSYACWCGPGHPPPPPAVRIRTTVGKLEEAMRGAVNDSGPAKAFIGRVHYHRRDDLDRAAARLRNGEAKEVSAEVANGLHMKRTAFAFEKEIRVLWVDQQAQREETYVTVDPHALIDQVMVGPSKHADLLAHVNKSVADLGFDPSKSSIYTPPSR